MAARGQAMVVEFHAWDTSANAPKTGDAANITLRWVKDGTSAALTTTTVTEVDATNAKGIYKCSLSATETDCLIGKLCGVSATANIAIFGPTITFDQIPAIAAGSSGGLPTVDANNAVKVQSGTGANQISLSSGAVIIQSGTGTGQLDFTSGVVKSNLAQILGTALTETAGQIAAAFKKFFNVATPTGTVNSLPDATPGASGGLPTGDANNSVKVQSGIKKNVALSTFEFLMRDSTNHAPATGLTITATVSKDGGAFASSTNSATEVGNGIYKISLTQTEMNADKVTLRFAATGADDSFVTLVTDP